MLSLSPLFKPPDFYLLFPICSFSLPLPSSAEYTLFLQCFQSVIPPGVGHSWWMIKNCRSSLVKSITCLPWWLSALAALKKNIQTAACCVTTWKIIRLQDVATCSCRRVGGAVQQHHIILCSFLLFFANLRGLTGQLVKREMRKSNHKGNIQQALTAARVRYQRDYEWHQALPVFTSN